ncbi:MAG: LysE family transporter [Pelolinea sp.]|nr:LysE family transporter [Pelolinea sp.]
MVIDFVPFIIFLFTSMITPGPNNITGASMGILHGYKKSYKYVLGVGAGFFCIMVLSGLLSGFLLKFIPGFERIVRVLGALYILWMAVGLLRSSFSSEITEQPLLGFSKGLLLQFFNPKVMVMGLTLYSSFLAPLTKNYGWLAMSALVLGGLAIVFTSIWTMAGSVLFQNLKKPAILKTVNLALALLLVYTAIEISGLLELISL